MDQLYPLLCADPRAPSSDDIEADPAPSAKKPKPVAADTPPDEGERRVEPPFSKPLTDREREAAFATIMWWAMHGGC